MPIFSNVQLRQERDLSDEAEEGWSIVERRTLKKVLLVFGVKKSLSLLELKILCYDVGLDWLISRNHVRRFGNHIRIFIRNTFVAFFTPSFVRELSRLIRVRFGWRCVYDEVNVGVGDSVKIVNNVKLCNRFSLLQDGDCIDDVDSTTDKIFPTPEIHT